MLNIKYNLISNETFVVGRRPVANLVLLTAVWVLPLANYRGFSFVIESPWISTGADILFHKQSTNVKWLSLILILNFTLTLTQTTRFGFRLELAYDKWMDAALTSQYLFIIVWPIVVRLHLPLARSERSELRNINIGSTMGRQAHSMVAHVRQCF